MKSMPRLALFALLSFTLMLSACTLPYNTKINPLPTAALSSSVPEATQPAGVTQESTSIPEQATSIPVVTSTAVMPTSTSAPAAATSTQSVSPTSQATLPPNATRIQFAPGTTGAEIKGSLNAGEKASYALDARTGQTMHVEVWSPNADIYLEVTEPVSGKAVLTAKDRVTQWGSALAYSGDYLLSLASTGGNTSYTLDVSVVGQSATPMPSNTPQAANTAQPTLASGQFDPLKSLGTPNLSDPMTGSSKSDWSLQDGSMPDTDSIHLFYDNNKFYVTDKQLGWNTWWFSWRELKDFYFELSVNSGNCSGKDAYGAILRGPGHGSGVSFGYVVAFSCDGAYQVYRLDSIKPWTVVTLIDWTASDKIKAGSNESNVLGVMAQGKTLTIYANGFKIGEVQDDKYADGRYGVYISSANTSEYTYQVEKLSYWILK